MSLKVAAAAALHVSAATGMAWGYSRLSVTFMDAVVLEQTGGRFQYLTIQALVLFSTDQMDCLFV